MKKDKIKVIELFAGVGGFKLGLEGDINGKSSTSNYTKNLNSHYKVIWSNQFEPLTKSVQHASEIYKTVWPEDIHSNKNIEEVIEDDFKSIPNHDMLVGGFPCQDYSVATTLKNSKGLEGKKGVLWWSIYSILKKKGRNKAKYIILENVDRLLISPSNQRGRDFAVILSCLDELDYAVEWRVINAADYGMPQRRRRVFIVAYHKTTNIYKKQAKQKKDRLLTESVLQNAFPCLENSSKLFEGIIGNDRVKISNTFNKNGKTNPFLNSGFMIKGKYYTAKLKANYHQSPILLENIYIKDEKKIPAEFWIDKKRKLKKEIIKIQFDGSKKVLKTEWDMWKYLKGSKKELKTNKAEGYQYKYAEGSMVFPDNLESPSRTIITGEGGASPSRFKHVIEHNGKERRLISKELERLNMFPDDHTKNKLVSDTKRAFLMGNALVVGVVEKIGIELNKIM